MAWTAEDRRKDAPAIREVLRQGMLVRLAATIDTIDPPCKTGRPRDWSTVTVLGAMWHLAPPSAHRRARPHGMAEGVRLQPSCFGRGGGLPLQAGGRRRVALAHQPGPGDRGRRRRPRPEPDAGARPPGVRPRRVSPGGRWAHC